MKIKQTEAELMVEFLLLWYPWGGASEEDIMIRFGLPATTFYRRVFSILDREQVEVEHRKAQQLKSLCAAKLCRRIFPVPASTPAATYNTFSGTSALVEAPTWDSVEAHRTEGTRRL